MAVIHHIQGFWIIKLGFVISGFCSRHFTPTLARLKNVVHYGRDLVIKGSFISGSIVSYPGKYGCC